MSSVTELLHGFVSRPRFEVIPAKGTEQAVAEWVPAGMTVTVTASPVKGLEPTIELAEKLAGRGYRVVPHLAARSVVSDAHLAEIVERLRVSGVDDVFVPGGDASHPAGPFEGALPLLERLAELGLDRHPELWPDYFGHYRRLVWLAQEPTAALAAEAERVAGMFGLPLTRVEVGVSGLEDALAALVSGRYVPAAGERVGVVVSGGNTVAVNFT